MAYRVVTTELTTPLATLEEAKAAKAVFEDMYPNATQQIVKDQEEEDDDGRTVQPR